MPKSQNSDFPARLAVRLVIRGYLVLFLSLLLNVHGIFYARAMNPQQNPWELLHSFMGLPVIVSYVFLWNSCLTYKDVLFPGIAIDQLVDVIDTDRPSIIDQSTINQTV